MYCVYSYTVFVSVLWACGCVTRFGLNSRWLVGVAQAQESTRRALMKTEAIKEIVQYSIATYVCICTV